MTARHGTASGFAAHQRAGERPCDPCYRAKQKYDQRYRSAPDRTRRSRLSARAQQQATSELARRYPDEYRQLYLKFKQDLTSEAAA